MPAILSAFFLPIFEANQLQMKLSWVKTHWIIKKLFSGYLWDIPNGQKEVYLTFDDGPTAEITDWTLAQLQQYNAKATFFCIGKNIKNHPDIFEKVVAAGHSIGNHTFNHLNGWQTANKIYLKNVEMCAEEIPAKTKLFRPPYGKIKPSQAKALRQSGYKIIMWDVLSEDYDASISAERCLENVMENVRPGSIIVFHDSVKAYPHLEYVLPKTLKFLNEKGFVCEGIA